MTPRLLLGSFEVPGLGGSSTASYALFRRMLADGWDVHYLNLVEDDPAFLQYVFGPDAGNPDRLPDVHDASIATPLEAASPAVRELIRTIEPDVLVGFGYIAALQLKRAAPDRRTVLVTGTCRQAQDYVTTGRAADAVGLARALAARGGTPRRLNATERLAFEACDLVVTHSALVLDFVHRFFPEHAGKIHPGVTWFAEWICDAADRWRDLARPFEARDIDALFVASSWERREKNWPMVAALARRLHPATVHVVGEVPNRLPSVTHHDFLADRRAMFALLGRARCVVCPSRIDAAPGVLFEAAAMGCNVVASRNCGNWELCPADLLAEPAGAAAFVQCIRRGMARPYESGLERFLGQGSYAELLRTLEIFARPFPATA